MKRLTLAIAFVLLVGACGDDDAIITTTTGANTTTGPSDTTTATTSPPTGAVTDLEGVRAATVQIVAQGTFVDPAAGVQVNQPGAGSGFIIDSTGLAVTNNHVVTGAALLQVYVQGDDQPRNAVVVGVSECSDLAVIDIAGEGFPYLTWYDGPITTGLEVYVAGYPLGDPEYTLLDGIVSKEQVDGETSWSSVDSIIEHSADTLGGNSGGPVVTADGRVLAVNYAGNQAGQSFAIGLGVARPTVDTLLTGIDTESIGVNGEAMSVGGFNGVWVYSVKSGAPADQAGVRAGDLILSIEDFQLATDGTMAEYCDILRSHRASDVLTIEVYRPAVDQILRGQLNGRELEAVVIPDIGDDLDDGGLAYSGYQTITDDSGLIEVSVPVEWTDLDSDGWVNSGELIGPGLVSAPSVAAWRAEWGTPGVFIGATDMLGTTPNQILDDKRWDSFCDYEGRQDYDDGLYTGRYDVYSNCGPEGSMFLAIAAEPADRAFLVLVEIVLVTEADVEATDTIIATFVVHGTGT
ncbi:MAG: S1C family serine protease [Acidimicrobiia bacterium]